MANLVTDLGPEDAEQIARALSEVLHYEVMSDWLEITKLRGAGRYRITIVEQDVMAKVHPYVDPPGYASFWDPMLAGYRLDGSPEHLKLCQHGQFIGMSTSGKSSLIQCAICYATRCCNPMTPQDNCVVWIGGNQKLYDLVGPWVEPYFGLGIPCPIDWIANGTRDALTMLATLMRIGRYRQSVRYAERGPWPWIFLILDEASFLLEDHSVWVIHEGRKMFPDTMAADNVRGVGSANAALMFATQHDVNAGFGDKGGTLQAQLKYTGAFQSRDKESIGRLLGDWKLQAPRFQGELWIDLGDGRLPFRLKAPYPQTDDTSKPRLHNGLTVSQIAESRQRLWTPDESGRPQPYTLDPRSAAAGGPDYANRYRLVDDRFIAYLSGNREVIQVQVSEPEQLATAPQIPVGPAALVASAEQESDDDGDDRRDDGIPQCDRDLAAKLAQGRREFGIAIPDELAEDETLMALVEAADAEHLKSTAAPSEVASVTSLADRRDRTTWAERIEVVLREHPGQTLTRAAIDLAMQEHDWRVSDRQIITNTLSRMTTVARTGDGYRAL